MGLEPLVVILLVLGNGFFALAEIAIVSARRARLQEMADRGSRGARVALRLTEEPTEFLATVQIGISLIGVVSGAYAGVTIGEQLAEHLARVPVLAPHAEGLGVGLVVVVITYLSLVVGELVPKRVALSRPEGIAAAVAPLMYALSRMVAPLAWLLTVSTNALLFVLRIRPGEQQPISHQELRLLVSEGTEAGVFEPLEQDIIERLLRLDDRTLQSVMTPRRKVVWLTHDDDAAAVAVKLTDTTHSHLPVLAPEGESVVGVLDVRRLLAGQVLHGPTPLDQEMAPPLFLPEGASLLDGMQMLRENNSRLGVVVDEYGSVQGIVTLDDVVQALIGGRDVTSEGPMEITPRREGGFLVDGSLPMVELREYFALPVQEGNAHYHTVAGLAMEQLGDIPSEGDSFVWENLRFEVLDMDGHRVDKLLVSPIPADTQ